MIPTFLAAPPGGRLSIGEGCFLNYGVTLDASVDVTLGAQCKIGSMVVLRDDDGRKRLPIVVGDRVWLAHGVVVQPGVRIGAGSVVSAGSVVVQDVRRTAPSYRGIPEYRDRCLERRALPLTAICAKSYEECQPVELSSSEEGSATSPNVPVTI
jgi:tetrahydrodipicolinate N-succinyltransferase